MSAYIDASAFIAWEREEFDLVGWVESQGDEPANFPATVWQELNYGVYAWAPDRAAKRRQGLAALGAVVMSFRRAHAVRAAQLAAELRREGIGLADCQIAAMALEDGAQLLTFNRKHFERVPGLRLAEV